jgi:hypothetical protein
MMGSPGSNYYLFLNFIQEVVFPNAKSETVNLLDYYESYLLFDKLRS